MDDPVRKNHQHPSITSGDFIDDIILQFNQLAIMKKQKQRIRLLSRLLSVPLNHSYILRVSKGFTHVNAYRGKHEHAYLKCNVNFFLV